RTLDTLLTYTHFPGVRLKPLGHLSDKQQFKFSLCNCLMQRCALPEGGIIPYIPVLHPPGQHSQAVLFKIVPDDFVEPSIRY
ncbi:MAG TPA: hypothetical protein VJ981_03300, partial [Gammaproteobacteria bacterium]|nr:hypothetical protein [Gammaproteobacteria bacterium]